MNVHSKLREVFREVLDADDLELTDDLTARDVESWDSLAHINLMFAIESEFDVQFTDEQITSFQSVGELRRFLEGAA